jgi:putative transposase
MALDGSILAINYAYGLKYFHVKFIAIGLATDNINRKPLLKDFFRYDLQDHIMQNCKEKEIFLQAINGYTDHQHCLISLGKDQSISKIVQLIKGESSFWINQNHLTAEKFTWQDDYFAVSVSESQVEAVIKYINNQEKHHAKKSFNQEVDEFMVKYGWQLMR